jgi:hypothetical protein
MTAFLAATLLALVTAGALTVVWKERREQFRPALMLAVGIAAVLAGYAWWATHGHAVTGDEDLVQLTDLKIVAVAGSQRVTGTLHNLGHDRSISAVPLVLLVDDCRDAVCTRLAEIERPLVISVPPAEQRPFVAVFNTPALSPAGTLHFRVDHRGPRTHPARQAVHP